jgi:molecular chaperone GrpE (heat shock protein)
MNKHFEDSRYYLRRATETAAKGLSEEIAAVEARLRELTGRETETETETGRLEEIRADLEQLQERAEGEAREAIGKARDRLAAYQAGETEEAEA